MGVKPNRRVPAAEAKRPAAPTGRPPLTAMGMAFVVGAVARHTASVLWSRKLWGAALCFMGITLLTALWFLELGPGIEWRLMGDVELAALEWCTFGGAILAFGILGFEEHELRTVWLIVSKPISRSQYVLGKAGGILTVLAANGLAMMGWMAALNVLLGIPLTGLHAWAVGAAALKGLVAVAAMSLVAVWASSPVSLVLLSSMVLFVAHLVHHLHGILRGSLDVVSKTLLTALYYLFPNFHYLNVRDAVWADPAISWMTWMNMTMYSGWYTVCALAAACIVFSRKEFV